MTLYGVGLGPGDADLVTVRGRELLETADIVYTPGRLSRSVATEYVPEERIGDLDFPMTRDEEKLKTAWKEAAREIAPRARDATAVFVTLGDPNVYSTFGHLRRTLSAFHPEVDLEIVPGVSAVTAFTTALGIEIAAGSSLTLHEASRGAAPVGPDRMILFKVTDVPETHERLREAGYDVIYGRRLYMEAGETVVTDDPEELADRDYYTLAYAEKRDLNVEPATAQFDQTRSNTAEETMSGGSEEMASGTAEQTTSEAVEETTSETAEETTSGTAEETTSETAEEPTSETAEEPISGTAEEPTSEAAEETGSETIRAEWAEGVACGDELPEIPPRGDELPEVPPR